MPQQSFDRLVELARTLRLHVEGDEILYSEDQGSDALISVDHWLYWRNEAIRLELRLLARADTSSGWETIGEGSESQPLTEAQAVQLIEHWAVLQREGEQRARLRAAAERERIRAFGPRSCRGP